jgi:hypothetical protein
MFGDGALTFREFVMGEALPLATIHQAVLEFLRDRSDAVVYGAQAVNAYVDEPRMTQDVDLVSTRAAELAEEIRTHLHERFGIDTRVREAKEGLGYRVYQLAKPKNRHLVDVRLVGELPPAERIGDVLVVAPAELLAQKVVSYAHRRDQPKAGTDWRDIAMLLLRFPELRADPGPVRERLTAAAADEEALAAWDETLAREIVAEEEDDEFE